MTKTKMIFNLHSLGRFLKSAAGISFLLFTFELQPLRAAEWEVNDKFTVDGRSIFRSTVTVNSQSSQQYILGLKNPADNFAVYVATTGNVGIGTAGPGDALELGNNMNLRLNVNGILKLHYNGAGRQALAGSGGNYMILGDGNDFVYQQGTGYVGIGTTAPSQGKLHVSVGASGASSYLPSVTGLALESNGTNALQFLNTNNSEAFIFFGDPQSATAGYIDYIHSQDQMYFKTAGSYAFTIGNVGIGTTSPQAALDLAGGGIRLGGVTRTSWPSGSGTGFGTDAGTYAYYNGGNVGIGTANPGARLDVNGSIYSRSGAVWSDSYNGYSGSEVSITGGSGLRVTAGLNGYFKVVDNSNNDILKVNGSSGFVGIGTAGPSDALHVNKTGGGGIKVTSNIQSGMSFSAANAAGGYYLGRAFNSNDANDFFIYDNTNGKRRFGINTAGDSFFENGNVGIGTTVPRSALDIGASPGMIMIPFAASTLAGKQSGLLAQSGASITTAFGLGINGGLYYQGSSDGANSNFDFRAGTADGSLGAVNVRIQSNGSVGIGTTNPAREFHVSGAGMEAVFEDTNQSANLKRFNIFMLSGKTFFRTLNDAGNNGTIWLTADNSSGNIGIGETNPVQRLQIGNMANPSGMRIVTASSSTPYAIQLRDKDNDTYGMDLGLTVSGGGLTINTVENSVMTEAFRIQRANGNVGIGTTAPKGKLSIYGAAKSAPSLNAGNDDPFRISFDNTLALEMGGGTGTGNPIWLQAHNNSVDGYSYPLLLNPLGGNVGIGTMSAGDKLDVNGTVGYVDYIVSNQGSYLGKGSVLISGGSATDTGILTGGNILFGTNAGAGNYERMRITSTGNVGIGTAAPSDNVHISGSVNSSAAALLRIDNTYGPNSVTGIELWGMGGAGGPYNNGRIESGHGAGGYESSYISLLTPAGAGTWTNTLTAVNGNVGIGTMAPAFKVQIAADVTMPSDALTDGSGQLTLSGSTDGNKRLVFGYDTSSGNGFGFIQAGKLSTAWTNLALQPSGGRVGIGITNPGYKLDVQGGNVNVGSGYGFCINGTCATNFGTVNYWTQGTGGIYNAGNIGIGTAAPGAKLEIKQGSDAAAGGLWITRSSEGTSFKMYIASSLSGLTDPLIFNSSMNGDVAAIGRDGKAYFAGNVGIGTPAPQQKLHVAGNAAGAFVGLMLSNQDTGVGSTSELNFAMGNAGTGATAKIVNITESASNTGLSFYTYNSGLSEKFRIAAGGNVGIGTTNPQTRLDVNGFANIANPPAGNTALNVGGSGQFWGDLFMNGQNINQLNTLNFNCGANIVQNSPVDYSIKFSYGSGAPYSMVLKGDSGNVGIGTTGPNNQLEIYGSGTAQRFRVDRGSDDAYQYLTVGYNNITINRANVALASAQTDFSIIQKGSDASRTVLFADSNGNIGIGTVNPIASLHLIAPSQYGAIGNTPAFWIGANTSANLAFGIQGSYSNSIQSRDGTTSTWPLALNPFGGNVGIGTSGPGYKLDIVDNSANFTSRIANTNSGSQGLAIIAGSSTGEILSARDYNNNVRLTVQGNGQVGVGRTPGTYKLEVEGDASKTTAGSWQANSDRRIKTDISNIDNAVDTLSLLRPVKFKYTDEYKALHPSIMNKYYYNFIAQEFQQVFPTEVTATNDTLPNGGHILAIDPYVVTPYLVKAVQEQQKQIEALKAENDALKTKITEVEGKLKTVK